MEFLFKGEVSLNNGIKKIITRNILVNDVYIDTPLIILISFIKFVFQEKQLSKNCKKSVKV
jgi:hypothetical protein